MSELLRALGALCEPPNPAHRRMATALRLPDPPGAHEHTDLFLFQLYPHASVYVSADGMLGGDARGRIAGFWTALGLVPPAEPDHLAALLGLYAAIADREQDEADPARARLLHHARRALLHEHLLSWLPPFLARLDDLAPRFYAEWGRLLAGALTEELDLLGPPESLPVDLRLAPELDDPDAVGGEAFLRQLLVPVRTGMILVRDDLMAAASELGLGGRIAERRFVLRALLEQDAPATLRWLGKHADAAGQAVGNATMIDRFWRQRAQAAATLLAELASAANDRKVTHVG